jgi:(R,R)-butanediol dehydrogenase/meso-butanediol dehydrogenase/diacetyl reductase
MRALSLIGRRELSLVDIPTPVTDGNNAIIKISIAGICGSDLAMWLKGTPVGAIMGHEFCGTIVDPGCMVDVFRVGDRVSGLELDPCGICPTCKKGRRNMCPAMMPTLMGIFTQGCFAEYLAIRPDMLRRLPDVINDKEAALAEPASVALHAVRLAHIGPGDKVLITGGGAIGQLSAAWAKINGASYIALTEASSVRAKIAKNMGDSDEVFDAGDKEVVEKLVTASKGGFDAIIECTGAQSAVDNAAMTGRCGATIVLVGSKDPTVSFVNFIMASKEFTVKGSWVFTEEEYDMTLSMIAKGVLKVERFATSIVGIKGVQNAFERLSRNDCEDIKILVDMKQVDG